MAELTLQELVALRRTLLAELDEITTAGIKPHAIKLWQGGMSEVKTARECGVDRLTLRRWIEPLKQRERSQ